MRLTVLIVDNNKDDILLLKRALKGFDVYPVSGVESARKLLSGGFRPDIVFSDYDLGDGSGLDLLEEVKSLLPKTLCYLISGHIEGIPSSATDIVDDVLEKGSSQMESLLQSLRESYCY